jgi:hypothetical protein
VLVESVSELPGCAHQQVLLERARRGRHGLLIVAEAEFEYAEGVFYPGQPPALALPSSCLGDAGWKEVADATLQWLKAQEL